MKIIADAKTNHNGNIVFAKKLIEEAFMAGADIISFDVKVPELSITRDDWFKLIDTPWGQMLNIDCERRLQLRKKELKEIDKYSKKVGIKWMPKVYDSKSLNCILQFDIPYIELCQGFKFKKELIKKAKESKVHILLPSSELKFSEGCELSLYFGERYAEKYGLTFLAKNNTEGFGIIKRGLTLDKNMWTKEDNNLNKTEFKNFILNL